MLPPSSGLNYLRPGYSSYKKGRVAVSHWETRSDNISDPEDGGGAFLWNSAITHSTVVVEIRRPVLWLSIVFEISVFVQGSRDLKMARTPIQLTQQLEILLKLKIPMHTPIITKTEYDKNCLTYVFVALVSRPFVWAFLALTPLYQFSPLFNACSDIFCLTPSDWLRTRTYPPMRVRNSRRIKTLVTCELTAGYISHRALTI